MPLSRQGKGGIDLATYTANYGLHQWEATDDFLRTDFNTDFQKIDTAIGGLLVFGSFTGDGANGKVISLGFTPRAVYVCARDGKAGYSSGAGYCYGGLLGAGAPLRLDNVTAAEIVDNGFKVYKANAYIRLNTSGEIFYYVAIQ